MARIVSIGTALQNIYLVDGEDLSPVNIGDAAILGKVLVGGEVNVEKVRYGIGGAGANTAISLARHGHEVVLMGNVGRDNAGETVMNTLDDEGIDSSYIGCVSGRATGIAVVLMDGKSGLATTLVHNGVSGRFNNLRADDLDLIQPDWLIANSLNGEMEQYLQFFEKAHGLGTKILFRPGKAELSESKKVLGLLADTDVLVVDKKSAGELVPGAILTELLYHLNNYAPIVIITDGVMGGIAGNRETGEAYRFGIYEDAKIKDKSGVSDAFAAGFLAHFAAGKSLRQSLIFASANATSVLKNIGTTSGILTGSEQLHPMPIQKIN